MVNHLSFDVLSRLLDERVAPDKEARATRHLARCGRCRDEMRWIERIQTHAREVSREFRLTTEETSAYG